MSSLPNRKRSPIESDPPAWLIKQLSDELQRQRKENPLLKKLIEADRPRPLLLQEQSILIDKLFSLGYYDAKVRFSTSEDNRLDYFISAGSAYTIATIDIVHQADLVINPAILKLSVGQDLHADKILAAENHLKNFLLQHSCLYKIDVDYRVELDEANHKAMVTFFVEPSRVVKVGEIRLQGLESIKPNYMMNYIDLKKGECYSQPKITQVKLDLLQTNLILSSQVKVSEPDASDHVDLTMVLTEKLHRRVSLGAGYQTDEGFGVSAGWRSRNLMGRAQNLKLDTRLFENKQSFNSTLELPHFPKQKFLTSFYLDLFNEDSEAYKGNTINVGTQINKKLGKTTLGRMGLELERSNVNSYSESLESSTKDIDQATLLSLPIGIEIDRRDSLLNPREGWASAFRFAPYIRLDGDKPDFNKGNIAVTGFYSLDRLWFQPTFASRFAVGVTSVDNIDDLPISNRYFVGGGGSVRGYPYKSLGPRLDDGEPTGGLSFLETSFELRLNFSKNWGGAMFVDGGTAYTTRFPNSNESLKWASGLGIRYFSSIAPIRFDIAVPHSKLEDSNAQVDSFQIYLSIGQAF